MKDARAIFASLPAWLRPAGLALAWLALTAYFHTPVREVLAPTLDGSNYASYSYFTAHGFQYGREVVPMAGPYGFIMYGWTYAGHLFWVRTVLELALNGALAALTLWFMISWRRSALAWLWLAAHLAFTPFIEDLPIEWLLLLAGFYCVLTPPRPGFSPLPGLVVGLIALLSLVKGTQFFLGIATLGVVLGAQLWQGHRRHAAQLGAAYFLALLLCWIAAGQSPLNLPAYVRGMIQLGGGYTDAMSLDAPSAILWRGLLVSAGLAAALAWALWRRRRDAAAFSCLLMLLGYSFVEWKHGFVRADGHAYIYFHYAVVAVVAIYVLGRAGPGSRPDRLATALGLAPVVATFLAAGWGHTDPILPGIRAVPAAWTRFTERVSYLSTLPAHKARLDRQLDRRRQEESLPVVARVVGRDTIDHFGYEHGLIPLNGLNYRPRPMGGGSFNAYTPMLMRLNRDFLRDPVRRPAYYLLKPQTIDGRLLAQDDGLALLEIIHGYQPVLLEREQLLLRSAPVAVSSELRLLETRAFSFGEKVAVPAVGPDELLLVRFDLARNFRGWMREILYKAPSVFIQLESHAGTELGFRRLIPSMARSPFLFSPFLNDFSDLLALYDENPGRGVGHFTLRTSATAYYHRPLRVEFYACPRPPRADPGVLRELRSRLVFPFANLSPESITPAFRDHPAVRFVHAPSEAVWNLTGGERLVRFDYGLDPQAYERGTTNGVEFIVEIRGPTGGNHRVFSRLLQPRDQPADRGPQSAELVLPLYAPGSRLMLRTDPGAYGDNAWDWAYFTRMDIQPGSFPADQFPGFNRIPDAAEGEHAGLINLDGRKALMLHVPGNLTFRLDGTEQSLALDFGFLPGAYTDGGQTPGADFIVELLRDGEWREIFRRELRPVAAAEDRGGQSARIVLPGVRSGHLLKVRIATPPGAGNSWGWTYLSRLAIE